MYRLFLKRVIDFLLSLAGVLILWPGLVLISVLIKLESGGKGNIIFKQKRIGIDKTEFFIYKFRTMRLDTPKDVPTHLLTNPDRYITDIGKFLRKTSLDELPQIFNILRGEMSIVGPRPALWNQYDLIKLRDENGANKVRPGLTGLAQIKGRDELPIRIKARFDGRYVKQISLSFDLFIIVSTIKGVLTAKGIQEGNTAGYKKGDSL